MQYMSAQKHLNKRVSHRWNKKKVGCQEQTGSDLELSKTSADVSNTGLQDTTVFMSIWLGLTCMEMCCILSNRQI